jgi:hypothetical protein
LIIVGFLPGLILSSLPTQYSRRPGDVIEIPFHPAGRPGKKRPAGSSNPYSPNDQKICLANGPVGMGSSYKYSAWRNTKSSQLLLWYRKVSMKLCLGGNPQFSKKNIPQRLELVEKQLTIGK